MREGRELKIEIAKDREALIVEVMCERLKLKIEIAKDREALIVEVMCERLTVQSGGGKEWSERTREESEIA